MEADSQYELIRIFNHNVVLVETAQTRQEAVLIGKGIGFGQKTGAVITSDDERIEKKYFLQDEIYRNQYRSLMDQVDPAVLGVSEEIIGLIAKHITPDYNEHIHIALPDHISFAIYRLNNQMEIINPFLHEIEMLYPKEFELAGKSAELVEKRLGTVIPESEVGFLALHIHSAVSQTTVSQTVQFTNLIRELLETARIEFGLPLLKGSVDNVRFITHLRYALERLKRGKPIENLFLERIQEGIPVAFHFAERLATRMEIALQLKVPLDEVGYIAMHVHRLMQAKEGIE